MESSRRDLLIDMVVDRFILKNNEITLSPCFSFLPETGVGLPKAGLSFHWARFANCLLAMTASGRAVRFGDGKVMFGLLRLRVAPLGLVTKGGTEEVNNSTF